ncbi:MAG: hypothetical protein HQK49_22870 [Oligoflexia bacterium]|nr:hypothetical protein [Oligoflexia bacterium]
METKIQKIYTDYSLGFPVIILNAPLVKTRGVWALNVNYNKYQDAALILLAHKITRITGNEVQFIRKYFQMTYREFAERFSVKHPAVIKWEKKSDNSTDMAWTTEKDIRLFIIDHISKKAEDLRKLYRALNEEAKSVVKPIEIDSKKMVA